MDGKHPDDVWEDYLLRPKGYDLRWALWTYEAQEQEKRLKELNSRKPRIR